MASSMFEYAVSRPYPFRWSTPVVFIGGGIALLLFSSRQRAILKGIINHTFQIDPSCQAENVQVNTEFFTNQTAPTYTLTAIWTTVDGSSPVILPALTYLNNSIQNCQINNIKIAFEAEGCSATQYAWNAWGETLQQTIDDGYVQDFPRPTATDAIQDIIDLAFWNVDYSFLENNDISAEADTWGGSGVDVPTPPLTKDNHTVSDPISNNAAPNIWLASDSLAKPFYSTILTDLGQTTTVPNILLNATTLQYFTQSFTYMQKMTVNAWPGPARGSYEAFKDQTGPLNTSTAVISTKYLCQVPRRKSTGTLLLSILVTDLVVMQALWKIFELCTAAWLVHKDPRANDCSGCCGQRNIPLASLGPKTHK
ncbi:hypothetical protein JMJ35_008375 [Cladonia borealis]|uniref:Uncharacterized protein n=1 Tax=Cladonia borealis TaxID=184061 RepID=A0AA39QVA5_9LECA|nr:hypothetical protein JMJ35_008375 [Cladonia borealis]